MTYDIHNQKRKQKGSFTHALKHRSGLNVIFKHEEKQVFHMLGILAQEPFELIIELGTHQGGLTKLMEDIFPSLPIHTYDNVDLTRNNRKYFGEKVYFHIESVLVPSRSLIKLLSDPAKKLLYCDNGKKKQEVEMYSQYLYPGDLIAVHDWGNEIFWEDVQSYIGDWRRIGWPTLEYIGSTTRIWQKV